MKYTGKIPYGINQTGTGSIAVSVENVDVASFTSGSLDVSGSLIATTFTASTALINGDVRIKGTASVDVLITSYESSSIIYSSGSTKFGDTLDDTHQFTGSVYITSSLDVTGGITGSLFGTASYVPTLDQVTTAGNTTTNAITVGGLTVDTNTLFVDATNNRVGIGTLSPAVKLTVQQSTSAYSQLETTNFDMALGIAANTNKISGLDFKNFDSTGQVRFMSRNNVDDYIALNSYGSSAGGTLFGISRNNIHALFGQGVNDTSKKLVIGTFNLGDLIFGTNNTERIRVFASTGNLSIGTIVDAGYKLDVNGSTRVKGSGTTSATTALLVENANASGSMVVLDNGNVGIGTSSPSNKLDVIGNIEFGAVNVSDTWRPVLGVSNLVYPQPFLAVANADPSMARFNIALKTDTIPDATNTVTGFTGPQINLWNSGVSKFLAINTNGLQVSNGTSLLLQPNSGNVGIGTTTPAYTLDVSGSGNFTDNLTVTGSLIVSGSSTLTNIGPAVFSGSLTVADEQSLVPVNIIRNDNNNTLPIKVTNNNAGGKAGITFSLPNNNNQLYSIGVDNDRFFKIGEGNLVSNTRFVISPIGNIGIGTTSPSSRLQVKGSGTTNATTAFRVENANASGSMVVLDDGNVGIGTTTPTYKLDITGTARITSGLTSTGTNYLGLNYLASNANINSTGDPNIHKLSNDLIINAGASPQSIYMYTNNSPILSIKNDGNIGIGITTPSYKLDVSGSGNFTNNLTVTGSLTVSGSSTLTNIGPANFTGSVGITGETSIYKSGSTVLDIQGSQGQLFSVVDELSGSLMSVNDISGLPILEVFSDDRVVMGTYGSPGLIVTGSTIIATGSLFGTSSLALTASYLEGYVDPFPYTGSAEITGSLGVTGSLIVSGSDIFIQNNQFYSSYNATGTAVGLLRLTPSNNTQLRAQSGNNIAFETDGQNVMWIGNDQRVGIGTISPSAKLQVKGSGTTSATTAFRVEDSAGTERFKVLDNGRVSTLGFYSYPESGSIVIGQDTTTYLSNYTTIINGSLGITGLSGNTLNIGSPFNTSSFAEGPTILYEGRNLEIGSWDNSRFSTSIRFNHENNVPGSDLIEFTVGATSTATPPLMVISASGNIGIGTTTPSYKLDVSGSGNFTNNLTVTGSLTVSGSSTLTNIGPAIFSGSLVVTEGITGSLFGTSSYALTASYLEGYVDPFPYTGSAEITGSLGVTGPLTVTGSLRVSGSSPSIITIGESQFTFSNLGSIQSSLSTGYSNFRLQGNGNGGLYINLAGYVSAVKNFSVGNEYVNSSVPPARLTVKGSGTTSATTAFRVENANASGSMVVLDNGNVGIGTTTPSTQLDINGTARIYTALQLGSFASTILTTTSLTYNAGGANGYQFKNNLTHTSTVGTYYALNLTNNIAPTSGTGIFNLFEINSTINQTGGANGITRGLFINPTLTSAADFRAIETTVGNVILGSTSGNVGIGTTTPTQNLQVSGSILVGQYGVSESKLKFANVSNEGNSAYIGRTSVSPFEINAGSVGLFRIQIPSGNDTSYLSLYGNGVHTAQFFRNQRTRFGGNVTTNPSATVEIKGEGTTSATTALLVENANASGSMVVLDNGNVGIGTTSPTEKLHVAGDIAITNAIGALNFIYSATPTRVARLDSDNGNLRIKADVNGTQANSFISFNIDGSEKMRITSAGNVGIGTTTPSYKLDVSGSGNFTDNLTVTGSLNLTGALTASSAIISGDVIIQGTASVNTLIVNQTQLSTGSNQLGDAADDFQTLYGTVIIPTGSLTVTGSTFISSSNATQLRVGNNLLFVSSSGNVGIGTTTPTQKLTVEGNVELGTGGYIYGDTTLPYVRLNNAAGAYLGYDVDNYITVGGPTTIRNANVDVIRFRSSKIISTQPLFIGTSDINDTPTSRLQVKGSGTTSATTAFRVENANASGSMVVLDNGDVGIGTTAPLAKFDVALNEANSNTAHYVQLSNIAAGYVDWAFSKTLNNDMSITNRGTGGGNTPVMTFKYVANGGNVGIGTTTPSYKLDVSGSGNFTDNLTVTGSTFISSSNATQLQVGNNLLFVSSSGNIGIGTTTPSFKFDALGSATSGVSIVGQFIGGTGTSAGGLKLGAYNATYGAFWSANITPTTSNYALISNGTDTGLNSTSVINFYINNSSRATVTSTGLGIGITTPTSRLQVKGSGTTSATTAFRVENANASSSMVVLDDGNVGIGTTSPASKLSIRSETATHQLVSINRPTSDIAALYLGNDAQTNAIISANNSDLRFGKDLSGTFSEYVRIKDGGNVGIGTTTPSVKLEIADSIPVLRITGTRDASWTIDQIMASLEYFSTDASGTAANSVRASINLVNETSVFGSTTGLSFSTKGDVAGLPTERMRINASGNVGIGTTAPTAKLQVKGSGTTSATTAFRVENANASNSLVVLDNGQVGIGVTNPTGSLTTNGNIQINNNGGLTFYNANSIFSSHYITTSNEVLTATSNNTYGAWKFNGYNVSIAKNLAIGTTLTDHTAPSQTFLVSGSTVLRGNTAITGSTTITGSLAISGSTGTSPALTIYKSGSTVFQVQGSQGELFAITDSLSGSLFSVSNISGLPIMEVFSDNTTLMGDYLAPALMTTKRLTVNSGSTIIYSIPTASYDGAFFEYTIKSGSNARAGQIFSTYLDTTASYTDNSTSDIGDTTGFIFGVILSGSNMVLTGSASTDAWTVKTIIRSI